MPGLARAFLLPIVAEIIDSRGKTTQSSCYLSVIVGEIHLLFHDETTARI
jgi:hypothetical protein